jgi:soluble lytic murein transglycosylase-like protein
VTAYRSLIERIAKGHGLDVNLVEAVVLRESSGQTDAFRFEPKFFDRYLKGKPEYKGQNPRRVSSSYGLLQVMYTTAQQYGYSEPPEHLFVPETGLHYGCLHLRAMLHRFNGNVRTALAAYNGGPGGIDKPDPQRYAGEVLTLYRSVEQVHPHTETV